MSPQEFEIHFFFTFPNFLSPYLLRLPVTIVFQCENLLDEIKGGTVLYQQGNPSGAAERWCSTSSGWRYIEGPMIVGSEDQCVVLMDAGLAPEYISRGICL